MKPLSVLIAPSMSVAIAFGLAASFTPTDASAMSKKERQTLVGALAGGVVGNATAKDRQNTRRWEEERDRRHRDWRRGDHRRDFRDQDRHPHRGR